MEQGIIQYVFLENDKNIGNESFIEGKHYETENDYTILDSISRKEVKKIKSTNEAIISRIKNNIR